MCQICGKYSKLTFEHIPPKCALNNTEVKVYTGDQILNNMINNNRYPWELDNLRYRSQKRGFGGFTLCEKCNSLTGTLYGDEYKKWFNIVLKNIQETQEEYLKSDKLILILKNVYPARFIRQVLSIMCSTNPNFSTSCPVVKNIILDKNYEINDKLNFKIYMYLLKNQYNGYSGEMLLYSKNCARQINEVDLYPFGFYLSLSELEEDETEITNFIKYGYNDACDIKLILKVHEKNNVYPTDFRTQQEIQNIKKFSNL